MNLIVMAHRGEAQVFIKNLQLKANSNYEFLYNGDEIDLILTGEGQFNVFTKLGPILGHKKYKNIINLGIAGSLDSTIKTNEIYPIRTVYSFYMNEPVFHSFTSKSDSKIDCITANKRVLTDGFSQKLSPFAQIVDRELWAIGKLANELKINFTSYKLISDRAGAQTDCFDLKSRALEFSNTLFEYFKKLEANQEETISNKSLELKFHTSFTQKKLINNLVSKIDDINFTNIAIEDAQNYNELIENLEKKLNPINHKAKEKIINIISPLAKIGAQVHYDKKLESKKIKLSMEINSQKNIDNLKEQLEKFEYSELEKVWQGNIDV